MGLLDILETRLVALLQPIFAPIRPLIALFTKFRDSTVGIFDAASHLIQSALSEYDQIKNFKSRPAWKNRVISVPKAVENITVLAQIPSQVLDAFRDLIQQLRTKLDPAAFELEDLEGLEDLRGLIGKFGGKILAGFEKLLGAVSLILDALATIRQAITDLQTIVDAVTTVRQDIENLNVFFLSQSNPRKSVTTTDGEVLKLRIGNLHHS